MEYTENLSLSLPLGSELFNIQNFDDNYKIIDEALTLNKIDTSNFNTALQDIQLVYDACDYLNSTPEDISLSSILTAINNIKLITIPPMISGNGFLQKPTHDSYFMKNTENNDDEYYYNFDRYYYYETYQSYCPGTFMYMPACKNDLDYVYPKISLFEDDDITISIRFKYKKIENESGKLFILGNYVNTYDYENNDTRAMIDGTGYFGNIFQLCPSIYIDYNTDTLHVYTPNDPFLLDSSPAFPVSPNILYTVAIKIEMGNSFRVMLFNDNKELINSKFCDISNWDNFPYGFASHFMELYQTLDEYGSSIDYEDKSFIIFGNDINNLNYVLSRVAYGLYIDTINTFIASNTTILWGCDTRKMINVINRVPVPNNILHVSQFISLGPTIESSTEDSLFVKFRDDEREYYSSPRVYDRRMFLGIPYQRYDDQETGYFWYEDNIITFYIRFKYLKDSDRDYYPEYLLGNYYGDTYIFDMFRENFEIYVNPDEDELRIAFGGTDIDYFSISQDNTYYIVLRIIKYTQVAAYLFDGDYTLIESKVLDFNSYNSLPFSRDSGNSFYPCFGGTIDRNSYETTPPFNRVEQGNHVAIDFKNTFWTYDDEIYWGEDTLRKKDAYEFPTPTADLQLGNNTVEIARSEWTDYYFTPATTNTYHIYSTGSYDPAIEIYDNNNNLIAEDNDSGTDYNFDLRTVLTSNNRYRFSIYSYSGNVTINVTIESSAPPTPTPGMLVTGDNAISVVSGESNHYDFTPYVTGYYRFYSTDPNDPYGESIDPYIEIYKDSTYVDGDMDSGTGYNFDLSTTDELISGNTYDIVIGSIMGTGDLTVTVVSPSIPTDMLILGTNDVELEQGQTQSYSFTSYETGYYHIYSEDLNDSSGYSIDPSITIYYDGGEIGYDNDSGTGYNFDIRTELTSGYTYDIDLISSYGAGNLNVIIEQYNPSPDPPTPSADELYIGDNNVTLREYGTTTYSFTPSSSSYYKFDSADPNDPYGYSIDPIIGIYDNGGSMTGYDNDSGTGYNFSTIVNLTSGTTYDIELYSSYGSGDITVTIEDTLFDGNLDIGTNDIPVTEADDGINCYFTPNTTGYYHIYSTGDSDPRLDIYDGNDYYISGDDNSGTDNNFDCTVNLNANEKYRLNIAYFSGGSITELPVIIEIT